MPFRPEAIVIHEDVRAAYEFWETLATHDHQPAWAIWKSLLTCFSRSRDDAQ
jgi:hypothetical protein